MVTYRHRQIGYPMLAALAVVLFVSLSATCLPGAGRSGLVQWSTTLAVVGLLTLLAVATGTMSVEIRDGSLRWYFGPGISHWSIPLDEIQTVGVWTTKTWRWGIHDMAEGKLYIVSGRRGVWVRLANGKQIILGTDRAEDLHAALKAAIGPHHGG